MAQVVDPCHLPAEDVVVLTSSSRPSPDKANVGIWPTNEQIGALTAFVFFSSGKKIKNFKSCVHNIKCKYLRNANFLFWNTRFWIDVYITVWFKKKDSQKTEGLKKEGCSKDPTKLGEISQVKRISVFLVGNKHWWRNGFSLSLLQLSMAGNGGKKQHACKASFFFLERM